MKRYHISLYQKLTKNSYLDNVIHKGGKKLYYE